MRQPHGKTDPDAANGLHVSALDAWLTRRRQLVCKLGSVGYTEQGEQHHEKGQPIHIEWIDEGLRSAVRIDIGRHKEIFEGDVSDQLRAIIAAEAREELAEIDANLRAWGIVP